jgi:hypothetical protein
MQSGRSASIRRKAPLNSSAPQSAHRESRTIEKTTISCAFGACFEAVAAFVADDVFFMSSRCDVVPHENQRFQSPGITIKSRIARRGMST